MRAWKALLLVGYRWSAGTEVREVRWPLTCGAHVSSGSLHSCILCSYVCMHTACIPCSFVSMASPGGVVLCSGFMGQMQWRITLLKSD